MLPRDKDLKLEITDKLHVFKKVEGKHKHKERKSRCKTQANRTSGDEKHPKRSDDHSGSFISVQGMELLAVETAVQSINKYLPSTSHE